MNGFQLKSQIAKMCELFHVNNGLLFLLNHRYRNQYIRILNYHDILHENAAMFEEHIRWLSTHFENVDYKTFVSFMTGLELKGNHPGLIISFDDGLSGNYDIALDVLERYHFTGYFLISPDLIGTSGYMSQTQIADLLSRGHFIGSHTCTHHRMSERDTQQTLTYEIGSSREQLENIFEQPVDLFCWCGGETNTYTAKAAQMISKQYSYSFTTNSCPITHQTSPYILDRTNCGDAWPLSLIKFQICGFMDALYCKKRKFVTNLILGAMK